MAGQGGADDMNGKSGTGPLAQSQSQIQQGLQAHRVQQTCMRPLRRQMPGHAMRHRVGIDPVQHQCGGGTDKTVQHDGNAQTAGPCDGPRHCCDFPPAQCRKHRQRIARRVCGKAAIDKMAHDMAVDFRPHKVAVVSLWMGLLLTERTRQVFDAEPDKYADLMATAEHPEFSGRVIAALWADPDRMAHTGTVCIGAELGEAYGVKDINGNQPPSHRAFFGPPTTFGDAVVE